MKSALTQIFNNAVHSLRLAHATYIDKTRDTYLNFISGAYGVAPERLAEFSRADMRSIFKRANRRYVLQTGNAILPVLWGVQGVNLLLAGSLAGAGVAAGLAVCWAGIFVWQSMNKSKEGDLALLIHSIDVKSRETRALLHSKFPDLANRPDAPKAPR